MSYTSELCRKKKKVLYFLNILHFHGTGVTVDTHKKIRPFLRPFSRNCVLIYKFLSTSVPNVLEIGCKCITHEKKNYFPFVSVLWLLSDRFSRSSTDFTGRYLPNSTSIGRQVWEVRVWIRLRPHLTLIVLMWRIGWAHNNASK